MTALDADTLRDLRRSVTRANRRPFPDDYVPIRPADLLALLDAAEAVERMTPSCRERGCTMNIRSVEDEGYTLPWNEDDDD